jgi:hypothetical protein
MMIVDLVVGLSYFVLEYFFLGVGSGEGPECHCCYKFHKFEHIVVMHTVIWA